MISGYKREVGVFVESAVEVVAHAWLGVACNVYKQ